MSREIYIKQIIDRYVYDVARRLPANGRNDIERELRSLIDDMLAEKGQDPTEKDIDTILIELGSPLKFAGKYKDGKRHLIGPEYFDTYLLVLKIACCAAAFGLALSQIILAIMSGGLSFLAVLSALASLFTGLIWAFGVVTIIFAALEHFSWLKTVDLAGKWYPNELPMLPSKGTAVSRNQMISSIAFTAIVIAVFLFAPQVLGVFNLQNGSGIIPLFNLEHLRQVMPLLLITWFCGIIRDISKLVIGKYDIKLCTISISLDILALILSVLVFTNPNIWNPQLGAHMQDMFGENAQLAMRGIAIFTKNFIWVIVFAFCLEIGETALRTLRARESK